MRARTLRLYAWWITKFAEFCGGALTKECFEKKTHEFIEHLKREGYAPSTIRVAYSAIKMYAEGYGVNLRLTNLPPIEEKIPPYLEEDEVKKLIDGTLCLRDKAIITLLYDCGLRVGELVELNTEDLDLKDKTIFIKSREKSRFPQRLPISEKTAKILEEYIKEYGLEEGMPLFPSPKGRERISTHTVYCIVRSWSERILGKKVHPHMLRHTTGVVLRKHGADMEAIRDFLGHKSDVTTRRYARIVPTELKKLPSRL